MWKCIICRFDTEYDDAVAPTAAGGCICLRCYNREVGSALRLSRRLRQDLVTVMANAP